MADHYNVLFLCTGNSKSWDEFPEAECSKARLRLHRMRQRREGAVALLAGPADDRSLGYSLTQRQSRDIQRKSPVRSVMPLPYLTAESDCSSRCRWRCWRISRSSVKSTRLADRRPASNDASSSMHCDAATPNSIAIENADCGALSGNPSATVHSFAADNFRRQ